MQTVITVVTLCLSVPLHAAVHPKLNAFSEGEKLLYTRVIEAYRKSNLAETLRQRDLLQRNYPQSVHLDNAYYLTGTLRYQGGQYAEAVRDFAVVAERFPLSNKRAAALFAKAMTYQKLGLPAQFKRVMEQVVKDYPGSQEAQRAWMQLKVAGGKPGASRQR